MSVVNDDTHMITTCPNLFLGKCINRISILHVNVSRPQTHTHTPTPH